MGWLPGWLRRHRMLSVLGFAVAVATLVQLGRRAPGASTPAPATGEDVKAAVPSAPDRVARAGTATGAHAEPDAARSPAGTVIAPGEPAAGAPPSPAAYGEVVNSVAPGPYPGSAVPRPDGSAPAPEYRVKGNAVSRLCHSPDSPYFRRTRAAVWFRTEEEAVAAGFRPWRRR